MRLTSSRSSITAALLVMLAPPLIRAQDVRIAIGKQASPVPKECESVVSASIEGDVDVPALVKEATCKGAGEMVADYTYAMKLVKRYKKDDLVSEETTTFEVYAPTLKNGTRANGVLLVTSRNGVPIPPADLDKDRLRAGKKLEEEEKKIALQATRQPPSVLYKVPAVLPAGSYTNMQVGPRNLRGGIDLRVQAFLEKCELKFAGRQQVDDREMLAFAFAPFPDALFDDSDRYVKQLAGVIWIDAKDRIVARLLAWPASVSRAAANRNPADAFSLVIEKPPAVHVEMTRLPDGVWLTSLMRLNGADYPALFDRAPYESTLTYSEYKRFRTAVEDVKLETPK
jgi:hypothetical protein